MENQRFSTLLLRGQLQHLHVRVIVVKEVPLRGFPQQPPENTIIGMSWAIRFWRTLTFQRAISSSSFKPS